MKIHLIIFLGPNFKNSRHRGSPMTVNSAIVNIMNGVRLLPTQNPHFETKAGNKVVLLLSKLASGRTLGSGGDQLLFLRYPWGARVCDEPNWPLGVTTLHTKANRGWQLSWAELLWCVSLHTHAGTCIHQGRLPPTGG